MLLNDKKDQYYRALMIIRRLLLHCRSELCSRITTSRSIKLIRICKRGIILMKRSRDIIMSKILDICTDGANKTKIVYQANLNFKTVNPYLELLTKNGMINTKEERNLVVYETTNRGLALLDNYKQIQGELSLST
jgi:predicted transcriptional regulator